MYNSVNKTGTDYGVKEITAIDRDSANDLVIRRVLYSGHSPEEVVVLPTPTGGHIYQYSDEKLPFAEYLNGKLII